MTHSQAVATGDTETGVLSVDDARIPAPVRARFGDYADAVATVVPVIGLHREEWWLFEADGTLLDVLCRKRPADAVMSRNPAPPRTPHPAGD